MNVQQILSDVRKFRLQEGAIAARLAQNPSHPLLSELVVSTRNEAGKPVAYDVLMPGSVVTGVERAAGQPIPRPAYKMRRFVADETSAKPLLTPASYGVDINAEAIVRLASKSQASDDADKIKEQMRVALDKVEHNDRLKDRSFAIETPKGAVVAVGRRYADAYVDRYTGRDEEEIEPIERSLPDEDRAAHLAKVREATRRFVDETKREKPRKRKDQDQL